MINKVYEKIKNYIKEYYVVLLILLIAVFIVTYKMPYYISAPGGLIDTSEKVTTHNNFEMTGSLNMAYVSEIQATIPLFLYGMLNPNWDVESESEATGNGSMKVQQYRNKMLLKEANDTAVLVAFKHSNISYNVEDSKSYVTYIDNLAKTTLKIGDQILKINGQTINKKDDIYEITKSKKDGDKLKFTVLRNKKEKTAEATLIDVNGQAKIGIIITDDVKIKSDEHVDLSFDDSESGPSGGLMLALTIYSYLNKEDLTASKTIVGTGTIDKDGSVGEISGVKYKLMGAVKEKADVFLVPQGANYAEAFNLKNEKGYDIDLVPVETFDDALKYLKKL